MFLPTHCDFCSLKLILDFYFEIVKMFRNLIVLGLVVVGITSTVATNAFVNTNTQKPPAVGKAPKMIQAPEIKDKKAPTKEEIKKAHEVTTKLMKKAGKKKFETKIPKREIPKTEFKRGVKPTEIHVESMSSSPTSKVANKLLVQMRSYYGESCSSLMEANGILANACLEETKSHSYTNSWGYTYSYNTYATTVSAMKSTVDGVSYGTAVQTYFSYSDCYYPDNDVTEVSDSYALDTCYSYFDYSTWSYYSYMVTFSNEMPTGSGVTATEYQGLRACNANDQNGIKSFNVFGSNKCYSDDNGGSVMYSCSGTTPYVFYYSDSTCFTYSGYTDLSYSNCYDSDDKYRFSC